MQAHFSFVILAPFCLIACQSEVEGDQSKQNEPEAISATAWVQQMDVVAAEAGPPVELTARLGGILYSDHGTDRSRGHHASQPDRRHAEVNESQVMNSRATSTNVRVRTYDLYFVRQGGEERVFHDFTDYAKARKAVEIMVRNWSLTVADQVQLIKERARENAGNRRR